MTNSPHVPFFRPLIALLEERGHEVRVSARDFAQTLELLDAAGDRTRGRRAATRGRRAGGQGPGDGSRLRALRGWAGPQPFDLALSHASHELPLAARSLAGAVGVRVRLRVRPRPAHARLARGDPGRRSRRDPAGAARPARRTRRQGTPLPRAEGGVLPLGLLTRPRRCSTSRLGLDPIEGARRRAHAARGLALPPSRESALRGRARAARQRPAVQAVVLPRTPAQRDALREAACRRSSCRSMRSTHRA